jgi:predicted NBD/HSP70 family sugar kinase
MPRRPHCLGRLYRVIDLGERRIRIAVVDQAIELEKRVPHRQARATEREVFGFLFQDEIERLLRVIRPVELSDGVALFARVAAERSLVGGAFDHEYRLSSPTSLGPAALLGQREPSRRRTH